MSRSIILTKAEQETLIEVCNDQIYVLKITKPLHPHLKHQLKVLELFLRKIEK